MTQEHKDLLMKDLCSRLPFGVKVKHVFKEETSDLLCIDAEKGVVYCNHKGREEKYKIEFVKPYLRSMDSMTNEEACDYLYARDMDFETSSLNAPLGNGVDWLNAHHFDYRGLIQCGLAIEVTEKNNPYKL